MRKWLTALIVAWCHGLVLAQGTNRVMSGYAAISGPHAVLWVARDAALFERNGLRTEVAYIRSGSTMSQTLVAGEIQMAKMGGPAMLAAGVAGMKTVASSKDCTDCTRRDSNLAALRRAHPSAECEIFSPSPRQVQIVPRPGRVRR